MGLTAKCPACSHSITVRELFWTPTLLRFKCPHCRAAVQPVDRSFAIVWLLLGGVLGAALAAAYGMWTTASAATPRPLIVAALGVLAIAGLAWIKWRASLSLIRRTSLQIAK